MEYGDSRDSPGETEKDMSPQARNLLIGLAALAVLAVCIAWLVIHVAVSVE